MSPHVDFALGTDDAANIRFGVSAPHELVRALGVLQEPAHRPLQWGWLRRVRPLLVELPRGQLNLLTTVIPPRGYTPDFLTPPPSAPQEPLEQIATISQASPDLVSRDLAKVRDLAHGRRHARLEELLTDPLGTRDRLVEALHSCWSVLLDPVWAQARHVLEADLALRSRQLVREGLGAVIDSLHDRVGWQDGLVRVRTTIWSQALDCRGTGLLLVPSVFSWPDCHVITDKPAIPTIHYPAHGVTEAWPTRSDDHVKGLELALGSARARCLLALASPMSTTALAQAIDLTPPTATHHITALRAAGLVTSSRSGREMLHTRTALGHALATRSL